MPRLPRLPRRRAEAFAEEPKRARPMDRPGGKGGVVDVNAFADYMERTFGAANQEVVDPLAGSLALLDPRTAKIEVIEAARRGAIPQAWSPDHRRLLFSQRVTRNMQLFEYHVESDHVVRLTQEPGIHPWGCYGPDARLVIMLAAFDSDEGAPQSQMTTRILLTEPGGLNPQPISSGPLDHSPSCAPDGSRAR